MIENRKIDCIAFDLDGTLIDSVPEVCAAINSLLLEEGLRPISLEETVSFVSDGAGPMLRRAYAAVGSAMPEGRLEETIERYLEHYIRAKGAHTKVYSGVRETLQSLRNLNLNLGVCTNKPKRTTLDVLAALGLRKFFSAILCPEDVKYPKPDGRHLTDTIRAMGARPESAVYVGDSETDMIAARDAGITAIAVTFGYSRNGPEHLDADYSVDQIAEILELVR